MTYGNLLQGGRWLFILDGSGKLQLGVSGGNIKGTQVVADGQWHHIAVVLDPPTPGPTTVEDLKLYVDGTPDTGTYATPTREIDTGANFLLRIGASKALDGSLVNFLDGQLDEVRIYDRALTEQEIENTVNP